MALLEKHPPHVRRRLALIWTLVIAAILIVILIIRYTSPRQTTPTDTGSKLKQFYQGILGNTESLFNEN